MYGGDTRRWSGSGISLSQLQLYQQNMSDDEISPPLFYTRMGEFEFQIEGSSDESVEEVGEEFDKRLDKLTEYARLFNDTDNRSDFQ